MTVHTLPVAQGLYFRQTAALAGWAAPGIGLIQNVSQTLTFNQDVGHNIIVENIEQSLFFSQSLENAGSSYARAVNQTIIFTQSAIPRVHVLNISQTLIFNQNADLPLIAESILIFSQTATVEKVKAVGQTLLFSQQLTSDNRRTLVASQTLSFIQGATCIKLHRNFLAARPPSDLLYSDDDLTENLVCAVPIQQNEGVIFSSGSYTIELPRPDFNNNENLEHDVVNRRSRGGDLYIYRDPSWPKTISMIYIWSSLKPEIADKLLIFLRNTLGQIVTLLDHENRTYTGVIRSPESDVSEQRRDLYSAKIEFEVE